MGKDDAALGIYAYGLKNVPSSGEDYKVCLLVMSICLSNGG